MARRQEGPALYLEDLRVGQRFETGSCTVSEADITAFAAQFDPQPFHVDAHAARDSVFGGIVASGWHTAAITMRLLIESGPRLAGGSVGLGAEISWPKPVRPGDELHVDSEIVGIEPSQSRPGRGRATMRSETRNQRGEVVQIVIAKLLVPRRSAAPGQGS
jgi:acyl dehydratase